MPDPEGPAGRGPRTIALVGPYLSGKTTLLEAMLARTGVIARPGSVTAGSSVGDASPEAREQGMGVEMNIASFGFLGDSFTVLDCPGSLEFQYEAIAALPACDAAVVVCEADEKKLTALEHTLHMVEEAGVPHFLFVNKIDKADAGLRDILALLQPVSRKPLVLRQLPIWENGIATGFVDLALERAFIYREHAPSRVVEIPAGMRELEAEARYAMLEKLADYDDDLLEQLISDIEPPRDKVFDDLSAELRQGDICPVLLGAAEKGNGVTRLLKALRHEAPFAQETARRHGIPPGQPCAYIFKTIHTSHGGKLTCARIFNATLAEGAGVRAHAAEHRIGGVFSMLGQEPVKRGPAGPGEAAAFARLDSARTGETLLVGKQAGFRVPCPPPPAPVYGLAIAPAERKDEVKLSQALGRMIEEDPSLSIVNNADTGEMVLWGQGEMHLRVSLKKLARKYGVSAEARTPQVPYKETIRKAGEARGRHKKQSGGHGQFGDVVIEIEPRPRGTGFAFSESITGGVVPKQYFPAVEAGVRDYLSAGPLGFPVVDVAVRLKDGSYHSVDSSEQAFRAAGRLAMAEAVPKCAPVLLEPVMRVEISVPSFATSRINAMISARRGQIFAHDAHPARRGWDRIAAHIPEAEMHDLIVDIRSASAGVGGFIFGFDHLAEVTGKLADQILAGHGIRAA